MLLFWTFYVSKNKELKKITNFHKNIKHQTSDTDKKKKCYLYKNNILNCNSISQYFLYYCYIK